MLKRYNSVITIEISSIDLIGGLKAATFGAPLNLWERFSKLCKNQRA